MAAPSAVSRLALPPRGLMAADRGRRVLGLCGMHPDHQEVLKRNRVLLAKQLVLSELLEHLLEQDIITLEMRELVQARVGSFGQNVELLSLLPKRGPRAFEAFCAALRETKQAHLEELLLGALAALQHEPPPPPLSCDYDLGLPLPVCESCPPLKQPRMTAEPLEPSMDSGDGPPSLQVKPCSPAFYQAHCQAAYRMQTRTRGLALVLSNVHFTGEKDLEFRSGGDVDQAMLASLFKLLGYSVHVLQNQTAQEMEKQLQDFAQRPEHRLTDSCVVALLSHGVEGAIYGVDGKLLELQEVFRLFDNASCPSLQNKPKMFFVQACRGGAIGPSGTSFCSLLPPPSCSVSVSNSVLSVHPLGGAPAPFCYETDLGVDQQDGKSQAQSPGCEESDAGAAGLLKTRLPTRSDMICGYACLRGTAAMRNTKRGSWYIEALARVFSQRACDMHVADMLVEVNALIKEREGYAPGTEFHRCKEMSEYCSTLCRHLYLFPGHQAT